MIIISVYVAKSLYSANGFAPFSVPEISYLCIIPLPPLPISSAVQAVDISALNSGPFEVGTCFKLTVAER